MIYALPGEPGGLRNVYGAAFCLAAGEGHKISARIVSA